MTLCSFGAVRLSAITLTNAVLSCTAPLAMLLLAALPLAIQAQPPADSLRAVPAIGRTLRSRDALLLGTFTAVGVMAYHNDRGMARAVRRADLQDNTTLRHTATVFRNIGQPGVLVGAVTTYALGRLAHRTAVATVGLRVTEAIVVTGALTVAGKIVAGRARPYVSNDKDPADFEIGRGRSEGYTSMPSGHTSAAFATASVMAVEWRALAPRSARLAVPLIYAGATMVGLSRMYNDKHWASDVVAGAALGTLTGGAIARWGRAHPGHAVDRWLLPIRVAPAGGRGVNLSVALTVR